MTETCTCCDGPPPQSGWPVVVLPADARYCSADCFAVHDDGMCACGEDIPDIGEERAA